MYIHEQEHLRQAGNCVFRLCTNRNCSTAFLQKLGCYGVTQLVNILKCRP